ncbi:hypothetical protein QR680_017596 [Steinernema hermaphroditum]|uniref:Carbohydrate kinase PfkB domain-containing protein n=1 Tax=Steinernema hermaphroditum TaxID=289476 RepID=A0AA39LNX5_9BILA|nr:hypothetical protein QR680_017596 [Steinernema hermaphroditum]
MAASKHDVVVFGSIVHDLISYTERFPRPGESVRGKHFQSGSGGKGANQAVAAARLGSSTGIIGRVGADIFGPLNIDNLAKAGVDTSNVEKSETSSTGTATITVSSEGENSIVVTLGANLEVSTTRAEELESYIAGHKLILCQNEIDQNANLRALQIAREHGVTTFYNPAPGLPNINRTILPFTDVLCVNENEAEFITNRTITTAEGFETAALELLDEGPKVVIVTLESRRSILL